MKQPTKLWQLSGFAVTSFLGTILHFLYEWLGKASWIAPFSAVNESTWEHMKLIFWPMFIFAIIQSFFFKDRKDFWCVKLKSILIGTTLIPVIFYMYNGAIGKSPDWLNIAIFFICAGISYICEAKIFATENSKCKRAKVAFLIICIIAVMFALFTFKTPEINIFKDPITNTYGI